MHYIYTPPSHASFAADFALLPPCFRAFLSSFRYLRRFIDSISRFTRERRAQRERRARRRDMLLADYFR
jgi:hypothetical protein